MSVRYFILKHFPERERERVLKDMPFLSTWKDIELNSLSHSLNTGVKDIFKQNIQKRRYKHIFYILGGYFLGDII